MNRLRHALNYRERSVFKLVPAEIVARDSSTWWRTVTINRGKEDGIEGDMPVVTDEGLVGKTTTVSNNISVVLLVSDENCKVAARSKERASRELFRANASSAGLTPLLEPEFSDETSESAAGTKSLYVRRWRSFSVGLARRHGEKLSSPRTGWPGATDAGGRSFAPGGRVRGHGTEMIFFVTTSRASC